MRSSRLWLRLCCEKRECGRASKTAGALLLLRACLCLWALMGVGEEKERGLGWEVLDGTMMLAVGLNVCDLCTLVLSCSLLTLALSTSPSISLSLALSGLFSQSPPPLPRVLSLSPPCLFLQHTCLHISPAVSFFLLFSGHQVVRIFRGQAGEDRWAQRWQL